MALLTRLKELLKKTDMFATSQMLRYKDETQYATLTGAVLSLGIFIMIGLLVYRTVISTVQKEEIASTTSTYQHSNPLPQTIDFGTMPFGISVEHVNNSDTSISYFDVVLRQQVYNDQTLVSQNLYELSPCTEDMFNQSKEIASDFKDSGGKNWLCPSRDHSVQIAGKRVGRQFKMLRADVLPCGSVYSNKTNCANKTQMDDFFALHGVLFFTVYTVSPVVNPDEHQPITYALKDNYIVLTLTQSIFYYSQVANFQIRTDTSLLPTTSEEVTAGILLNDIKQVYPMDFAGFYGTIAFRKSPMEYQYTRKFTKIDETFSYVGGLIGVLVGIFFVMSPYTQLCFQLSLSNGLFLDNDRKPLKSSLNFVKYMGYEVYCLFSYCFKCCQVEQFEQFRECSDQMQKQLDISYLLKRISCLESLMYTERAVDVAQYKKRTFQQADNRASSINISEETSVASQLVVDDRVNKSEQFVDIQDAQWNSHNISHMDIVEHGEQGAVAIQVQGQKGVILKSESESKMESVSDKRKKRRRPVSVKPNANLTNGNSVDNQDFIVYPI